MSATIRPAGPGDIDAVCTLLHDKMNAKIAPDRWRRLMTYEWLAEKPDLGRVVEAGGRILGYVGMVYADRNIDGRSERIVNICAWYLDKSLRGTGLGMEMMAVATADPAMSYDIMTSSKNTLKILDAVGYRVLDDHRYVWRNAGPPDAALAIIDDPAAIRARASAGEVRLLDDMAGLPATPVLIEAGGARALLFFSVKQKGAGVTWFDLLHTGDRALFTAQAQTLANALLPDGPAVLAADARFVPSPPVGPAREPLPVPRFCKTERLAPHQIDHLYTELQLLDLKLD
ncbi:MAG TPA: GNAT family N-acetyltransferase [Alphaproteobacteria bacterium]|nr:GNAT family N-acetyltransferase [Alphaproteobacteria bacterium]